MARSVLVPAAVEYPSSDGTPVAESDFQLTPVAYARDALRDHFRRRPDVYVAANLFIYYEERQPRCGGGAGRVRRARRSQP